MRLLCAAALSLSFGLWFAYAEDKKPADAPTGDRAEKLAARKKKFEEENKELDAQLAKNPAAARAIQAERRELVLLTASKVLELATENPKDATGFDAAAFIVQAAGKAGATGGDVEKAVELIAEHHATNPKVKDMLVPAMGLGEAGEKLIKAVSEKATDKDTRGVAMLVRGVQLVRAIDEDEADAKKLTAQLDAATEQLNKAAKEAPDVKIENDTVGKIAAAQIEKLKVMSALFVGKPAPDVESLTLDGKKVKLSDSKGKVVLLDVWATWCGPCKEMIPHERELVKKFEGKPFELISVSVDNKKEALQKFLEGEKMPWTHWWQDGQENPVMKEYRVRAFPTLYVIDHAGVIRHKWVGNPGNDKIDAAIEELVKAAVKAKG